MAASNFPIMFQPLARYADFNGRARRSEYWLWALFLFVLNIVLTIIQYTVMFSMMGASIHQNGGVGDGAAMGAAMATNFAMLGIKFLVFIALIVPTVAVAVRRMHDINRTGWWILMPSAVALVATIVVVTLTGANIIEQISKASAASKGDDPSAVFAVMFAFFQAFVWIFLPTFAAKIVTFVFRVTEGTKGPNRFGPDPKNPAPTNVF